MTSRTPTGDKRHPLPALQTVKDKYDQMLAELNKILNDPYPIDSGDKKRHCQKIKSAYVQFKDTATHLENRHHSHGAVEEANAVLNELRAATKETKRIMSILQGFLTEDGVSQATKISYVPSGSKVASGTSSKRRRDLEQKKKLAAIEEEIKLREVKDREEEARIKAKEEEACLLYTSPSPRDLSTSRMPSSA